MANADRIRVEIVYAMPECQTVKQVLLPAGSRVRTAIQQSGVLEEFPGIDLHTSPIGIYGERADLDRVLTDGERVEIYRPLQADPKESRRRRAKKKK